MPNNLAHAGARLLCMAPDIEQLTPDQVSALHMFKHEVLAAAFRLYTQVPPAFADPILIKFFKQLPDQVPDTGS
jgi:hypothetical protein